MPRLILLRHATAERARPGESDHDRALTKGGRKEAIAAGKALHERGETIDLVLSSDSKRTRETWEGAEEEIDGKPEVRFLRAMFEANSYLPVLKSEGGAAKSILLLGHNPAMQQTAVALAENLSGRDGRKLASEFPKGAFAVFEFDSEWGSLQPGRMRLLAFIEPKA